MKKKPIIGITLDSEKAGGWSDSPWYALREDYANSVLNQGGIPIHLAHSIDMAEEYISIIDGLIITGGDFDIDPSYYGETINSDRIVVKNTRTAFEIAITKLALEYKKPILGICGGEQLLNVILGGTLIQHIPDSVPNCLVHEQPHPKDEPSHSVTVKEQSLLHKITGVTEMMVNSTHHQAVKDVLSGVIISAVAPDGVIEAIEYPAHPFCLGVEWHPEYEKTEYDKKIIKAFIEASYDRKNR